MALGDELEDIDARITRERRGEGLSVVVRLAAFAVGVSRAGKGGQGVLTVRLQVLLVEGDDVLEAVLETLDVGRVEEEGENDHALGPRGSRLTGNTGR